MVQQKQKLKRWAKLFAKIVLAIMLLGIYKDYSPVILESSSFWGTVYIYLHLGVGCFLVSRLLKKIGVRWHRELLFSGLILITLLLATETVLRFGVKTRLDYCEISGNSFRAKYFEQHIDSKELPYAPFDTVWTTKAEFSFHRVINENGIFEKSIPTKEPGEIRFLCLGDSFTEGVGTEYDSTWVKHTEKLMQQSRKDKKITFINAGTSGNDPFGEYHLLTTKLLNYQPDWVIMVTNNSDVFDYMERGGLERYKKDGTVSHRKGPWWYQAYRYSYIIRHIAHDVFHLKDFLVTEAEEQKLVNQSLAEMNTLFKSIDSLGTAKGFEFVLVLQPMFNEVETAQYNFEKVTELLAQRQYAIDLMPSMISQVSKLPPSTPFYWPLDAHYNALGYRFMAHGIFDYLDSIVPATAIDTLQNQNYAAPNH